MSLEYKILGQDVAAELFVDKKFVAVAPDSAAAVYSTDGIAWTQTTLPLSAYAGNPSIDGPAIWQSITYGGDKFVAISKYDQVFSIGAYSTDGLSWTKISFESFGGEYETWNSLAYGGGKFLALSYNQSTMSSTDGISWSFAGFISEAWTSMAYGNGKFVAIRQYSDRAEYSSDGGSTWSGSFLPASSSWQSITYGDGKFVAVAYFNVIAYSTDAVTWTQSVLPVFSNWKALAYGGNKFVAVAKYGNDAAYSTDGITWSQTSIPAANWSSVTYGNDKFVAVASGTTAAAYSTNGITWTQSTLPANGSSVTYGEKQELSENNQYTVPSTKEAIISSIYIANNSSSSQTYSVAVVPNGQTLSSIHYIRKDVTIDGNDFHTIPTKITLSAGDQIITEGSSTDVSINVFGVEK